MKELDREDRNFLAKFNAASKPATTGPLKFERVCFQHEDLEGKYYCEVCQVWRCKDCVNLYQTAAVCPDSDSLCLTQEKFAEQSRAHIRRQTPYATELRQALTFPLRHYYFSLIVWGVVWFTAAGGDMISDFLNSPSIILLLIGGRVGMIGSFLALFVLGSISSGYLMRRANGEEITSFAKQFYYADLLESIILWISAALIGLGPLTFYLGYQWVQTTLVFLITGNNYANKLMTSPTIFDYCIIGVLTLWAIFFYPLALVVGANQRSILSIFNPLNAIKTWLQLKTWFNPALAIMLATHLIAILISFLVKDIYSGLIFITASFTIAALISASAIGAAIDRGSEDVGNVTIYNRD